MLSLSQSHAYLVYPTHRKISSLSKQRILSNKCESTSPHLRLVQNANYRYILLIVYLILWIAERLESFIPQLLHHVLSLNCKCTVKYSLKEMREFCYNRCALWTADVRTWNVFEMLFVQTHSIVVAGVTETRFDFWLPKNIERFHFKAVSNVMQYLV